MHGHGGASVLGILALLAIVVPIIGIFARRGVGGGYAVPTTPDFGKPPLHRPPTFTVVPRPFGTANTSRSSGPAFNVDGKPMVAGSMIDVEGKLYGQRRPPPPIKPFGKH